MRRIFTFGALVLGCGLLSGLVGPAPVQPNTIVIVSGEGQVGASGQVLADPIVFQVKDSDGNPVAGVRVTVTIGTGGAFLVPDRTDAKIETVAGGGFGFGDGIPATDAFLGDPVDVAADGDGVLFVADRGTGTIRRIDPVTGAIGTVTGAGFDPFVADGQQAGTITGLMPRSVEIGKATGDLIFVDEASARVFRIDLAADAIFLVAGGGTSTADGVPATSALLPAPVDATEDYAGNVYVAADAMTIRKVDASTGLIGSVLGGLDVRGLEVHRDGARLSIADSAGYLLADPVTTATDLFAVGAASGVTVDVDGSQFYSLDAHRIEMLADGAVPPGTPIPISGTGTAGFAGDGGPSTSADLDTPSGLAVDPFGNVYVADRINGRVRKITFALMEVSEFTHYSDRGGFVTSYPIKVFTDPEVEATEEGTGQSTATTVEMVGEPGGAPANPDPNQTARRANSNAALMYPRWTPSSSVTSPRAPPALNPSPPQEPEGGSHKTIAVDSMNNVHVVIDHGIDEADLPLSDVAIWYFTDQSETRRSNGFSDGFPLAAEGFRPSIAVDADDDSVHVVWEGGPNILYRRLSQNPDDAGWGPTINLTNAVDECPGQTTVYTHAHLASDPVGGIHLVLTKTIFTNIQTGTNPDTGEAICAVGGIESKILYAKDELTNLIEIAGAVATADLLPKVDESMVEAGPDGVGQITFVKTELFGEIKQQFTTSNATTPQTFTDIFVRDFGVDGSNVPHFVGSSGPFGGEVVYRRGGDGATEPVSSGSGFRAFVDVEENGRPHITWPGVYPGFLSSSATTSYATRRPNAPSGTPFESQDPIPESLPAGLSPFGQQPRVMGPPKRGCPESR